ncbi:hypothetical protein KIPB_013494, partial [Kipferlia bialata]
ETRIASLSQSLSECQTQSRSLSHSLAESESMCRRLAKEVLQRRKSDPVRAERERQMQTQIKHLQTESEGLRAALQQESPRPPQRKRAPTLSTVETDKGERVPVPSSTQTHKVMGSKTTAPNPVPVSTRTPCTVVECQSEKGKRSTVNKGVLLQSRHGTHGGRKLVDAEADAESDTRMTKSKQVSSRQLESSEEDAEHSEGTASESDVLVDGESEESAWEETESKSESEEGDRSEPDSAMQDKTTDCRRTTVPKAGSIGVQSHISRVCDRVRPSDTVPGLNDTRKVKSVEGRRPSVYDIKWNARLEELRKWTIRDVDGYAEETASSEQA